MDIKKWLSRYPALRAEAYRLADEMEALNENASPLAREQFQKAEKRLNECLELIDEINAAVSALRDPQDRLILSYRYTGTDSNRLRPWREIARNIYGDDGEKELQRVYHAHRRALEHLADHCKGVLKRNTSTKSGDCTKRNPYEYR